MKFIRVERRGHVALVTIDRPAALNALNSRLLSELSETFISIAKDDAVRAVVLTGEGKAFVAGADIAEMSGFSRSQAFEYARRGAAAFAAVEQLPQPVIAAVNGFALGGGLELALACDIRLASEKAKFGQPETGLGITPGFGGTARLPRTVGSSMAAELILSARTIDAAEALRIGLVSAVYPAETLLDEALALAEKIAANAPFAVRAAKRAIGQFLRRDVDEDIAGEAELFSACFETDDRAQAMAAFLEKRKFTDFRGK